MTAYMYVIGFFPKVPPLCGLNEVMTTANVQQQEISCCSLFYVKSLLKKITDHA